MELVDRERSRLRWMYLAIGIALVFGATCVVLAAAASALGNARWIALPRPMPLAVWVVVLAADAALVLWTARRLATRTTRASVAAAIERDQRLRAGALRGALEMGESGALGRRAATAVAAQIAPSARALAPRERRSLARGVIQALGVAAAAVLALAWTAPSHRDGLRAIMRPVSAWRGTLLEPIAFVELPPAIMRGETLRLRVRAAGRPAVTLAVRETGEAWRERSVPVDARTGMATVELGPLRATTSLVASDGRVATDTIAVPVTDRPFVGAVTMRALYPAYLGRPAEGLPVGEPARVPQGTTIEVTGRASTALRFVALANGTDTLRLDPRGHAFGGRFVARRGGTWNWVAVAAGGPIADLPLPLELDVVTDSAPTVNLVSPASDTIVAADDQVTLRATASDDHGLAKVSVVAWTQPSTDTTASASEQPLFAGGQAVWDGSAALDLGARALRPGDALHVKIVAVDNSPWAQRGESRELLLRIPSMEERREIARAAADSAVSEARSAAQAQKSLEQRTSEAARDRGHRAAGQESANSRATGGDKRDAMSYEAAEKAKAVAKDQRALAEQVRKLQENASKLQRQLAQAGALDSSLARQLQEAQRMLRDALTPELMAQMQKLESATQQLSREQAQTALKDLKAMQERLREQLEKSAEMLRRAAVEGAMETLKDEANDIAKNERALADSSGPSAKTPQRDAAQRLADRSQRFTDDVKQLQERLEQMDAKAGAQKTGEARDHGQASEQAMRQSAMRQSAEQQAAAQASTAAGQMQQAAEAMAQAREQQVGAWKSELTRALDQSIQEMLQMARQESGLEQRARSGGSKPQELRGEQSAVKQGLDEAAQRLENESRKTSLLSGRSQRAMAEAQQKVGQATEATGQSASGGRDASNAAGALGDAADALNRAAASLARDRQKANTSSSATGFAEMLRQMQEAAKKQGAINAQAQGLFPVPGGSMTSQMQATARALAREQRQVAQQLDDVSDAAGGDRAAQLAREARQLAEALEGGRIDGSTIARQQQLFRRLLDAGRSLEKDERDDSNKREAKAATGDNVFTPANADASGKAAARYREPTWDELRGLTADERRAILEYFKRINGRPDDER